MTAAQNIVLPFTVGRQTSRLIKSLHLADLGVCSSDSAQRMQPVLLSRPVQPAIEAMTRAWSQLLTSLQPRSNGRIYIGQDSPRSAQQSCFEQSAAKGFVRLEATAHQADQLQGEQPGLVHSATNAVWLTEMKDAAMPLHPGLAVSGMHMTAEDSISFELSCKRPAALVALESSAVSGTFSDNLLTCIPGKPVGLSFVSSGPFLHSDFERTLSISSLADTLPSATI